MGRAFSADGCSAGGGEPFAFPNPITFPNRITAGDLLTRHPISAYLALANYCQILRTHRRGEVVWDFKHNGLGGHRACQVSLHEESRGIWLRGQRN